MQEEKNIEVVDKPNVIKKNNSSDITIVLMLVLIMGLFMIVGFLLFTSKNIKRSS